MLRQLVKLGRRILKLKESGAGAPEILSCVDDFYRGLTVAEARSIENNDSFTPRCKSRRSRRLSNA